MRRITHEGQLKLESRVRVLYDDGSERLSNTVFHALVVVVVGDIVRVELFLSGFARRRAWLDGH